MVLDNNWDNLLESIDSITPEEKKELDLMADIVSQIILKRKEKNISQKKLSEIVGIEKST